LRGIRRCETFRCVFILDPWFAGSSNVGTNKWRFCIEFLLTVSDLDPTDPLPFGHLESHRRKE
jgi:hypothetical protein